jgi:hypothetical protein
MCPADTRLARSWPFILVLLLPPLLGRAADDAPLNPPPVQAAPTQREQQLEARVQDLEAQAAPKTKTRGLIPGMLIGPRLALLNLPTPTIGLEVRALGYLGASFDYGFIPQVTISDVQVKYDQWQIGLRVYPFKGAFYMGGVYGHYAFSGVASGPSAGSGSVSVSSQYIGPQLGWRWVMPSGFFTGIDLSWGFPLTFESKASEGSTGAITEIEKNAQQYLQHGLPMLGLVSFGYLF